MRGSITPAHPRSRARALALWGVLPSASASLSRPFGHSAQAQQGCPSAPMIRSWRSCRGGDRSSGRCGLSGSRRVCSSAALAAFVPIERTRLRGCSAQCPLCPTAEFWFRTSFSSLASVGTHSAFRPHGPQSTMKKRWAVPCAPIGTCTDLPHRGQRPTYAVPSRFL